MSDIRVQFVYKGELRTGTVEIDTKGRRGLILLKTESGFRSFKCDEVTQVQYIA